MTFTVTPENVYFAVSLATLLLQAWQVRKVEKIKKEVDKCMLLCCRCHRELHAGIS